MKVIILAGGHGTRLSEETVSRPKPMVEIGGHPLLWHIMKIYSANGFNDFIVCLGYKGEMIRDYFLNYMSKNSDFTVDTKTGKIELHNSPKEDWKVTLVDTGIDTMTGGRLKRVAQYIDGDTFMMTYGDGVADIDIQALVKFHQAHGKMASVTAVAPPGRFGALELNGTSVTDFHEKPLGGNSYINGGFFVLHKDVLTLIDGDSDIWERAPMQKLSKSGNLHAFKHSGFWQPMDTLREKNYLEALWAKREAPWKTW